jgi:hypothetical protein
MKITKEIILLIRASKKIKQGWRCSSMIDKMLIMCEG